MDRDKLLKMAGAVRTGGKGTVRRCEHPPDQSHIAFGTCKIRVDRAPTMPRARNRQWLQMHRSPAAYSAQQGTWYQLQAL